jgi:hypothetical protein
MISGSNIKIVGLEVQCEVVCINLANLWHIIHDYKRQHLCPTCKRGDQLARNQSGLQ